MEYAEAMYGTPESEHPPPTRNTPPPNRIHSAFAYAEAVLYYGGRPPTIEMLESLNYTVADLAGAVQFACEVIVLRAEDNQTSDQFGTEADEIEGPYRPCGGSMPTVNRNMDLPRANNVFAEVMKDAALTCAWGYDESKSDFGDESVEEKKLRRSSRLAARNAAGQTAGNIVETLKRLSVEPQEKKRKKQKPKQT